MKRNYGIDLLRLVLMMMVVSLHVFGLGGILKTVEWSSANYYIAWVMYGLAYCAVDCFVLITGYVHAERSYKLSSFILLWLQAMVYSVGIAVIMQMTQLETISMKGWVNALAPVFRSEYWYLSAYAGLFFLMPVLNAAVKAMTEAQMKWSLLLAIMAYAVLPILSFSDPFKLDHGYSPLWFAVLYLVGAGMKKYSWGKTLSSGKCFGIYLGAVGVSLLCKFGVELATNLVFGEPKFYQLLIVYNSPTILLAAAALFLTFAKLRIPAKLVKPIAVLSPAAFGVYLIHENPYIRKLVVTEHFAFLAEKNPLVMVGGVLMGVFAIFVTCLCIDLIRHRIFTVLKIKERLYHMEEAIRDRVLHKKAA